MFSFLKSVLKSFIPKPEIRLNPITIDTLQIDISNTISEHKDYEQYMLTAEQLFELLNMINEPTIPLSSSNTKQSYFDTEGYLNKVDSYNDKIDDILNDISDQSDITKIKKKINTLQSTLTKFKEFLYSRGEFGKKEYLALHDNDFNDARDQLKNILLTDYPFNHLSK